ncbi:hypothetical protein Ciccas_008716 [Cichlidogyrus casuarinus]|uniref:Uncharacterized protein n=1 Tax=Cichlidogyrus casuarinus TaxID=1844966 RepID=A0ABD2Q0Q7_9PLAT
MNYLGIVNNSHGNALKTKNSLTNAFIKNKKYLQAEEMIRQLTTPESDPLQSLWVIADNPSALSFDLTEWVRKHHLDTLVSI